jgi:DNA-binding FrmR family transcriptional regulator
MVPYVDQQLYKGQAETILAATTNNISTYCAGCRETLAAVGGSVAHVLDLVFNPNWRNAVSEKANTGKKKRENQALLKKLLEEKMGVSSC